MKKIFALAAVLVVAAVVLTGCGMPSCGGDTATSTLMSGKPWENPYNHEKSTYKVERCGAVKDGDTWIADKSDVRATGTYVTEIIYIEGNVADWTYLADISAAIPSFGSDILPHINNGELSSSSGAYSFVHTTFDLTYTDSEHNGDYKGANDRILSCALFRNIDMSPVFSYKAAVLASSGISYTAFANYLDGTNKFKEGDKAEVVTEIESNTDNETLYLYARAQTGLTEGISTSVKVHSAVETGVYGKEAVNNIGISYTTGSTLYGVDPEKSYAFIPEYLGDSVPFITKEEAELSEDENDSEGYAFPVNQAVVYRNDTDMGTSVTLLFSAADFGRLGAKTSNVLLQMTTHENDPLTADPTTITTAKLSDYTMT